MIDLHLHSTYSDDGEHTPERLVGMAQEAGLWAMSITDHNCARANADAARLAAGHGIRYLCGIEVDCTLEGVGFHVLGYGIDPESQDFARIEHNVVSQRERISRERLQKLWDIGLGVNASDLPPIEKTEWTGEILAEALLADPAHEHDPRLMRYRPGGARADRPLVNFYWDFCSQGKPAHVSCEYPSMEETVRIIHRNGGVAVLAHPGVNLREDRELLDAAISSGLDGIEAYTSYHSVKQARWYASVAAEKGLLVTCGSDFHGRTKPDVALGGHGAPEGFVLSDILVEKMSL